MKTSVIGFPRIGKDRELKFASEKYFKGDITKNELLEVAKTLRKEHWNVQKENAIDHIASNDFSFYDNVLDTAVLFNVIPAKYKELGFEELDTYFAMARGYQKDDKNVKALAMKKWFNTNYHYIVPEIEDDTEVKLVGTKPFDEYKEALSLGVETKTVVIGPFTFLKLARFKGSKNINDFKDAFTAAYSNFIKEAKNAGVKVVEFDEPFLVKDLSAEDIALFKEIYTALLANKNGLKVFLQTYFGDVRDIYDTLTNLDFDA